jgi:hypothetical protein
MEAPNAATAMLWRIAKSQRPGSPWLKRAHLLRELALLKRVDDPLKLCLEPSTAAFVLIGMQPSEFDALPVDTQVVALQSALDIEIADQQSRRSHELTEQGEKSLTGLPNWNADTGELSIDGENVRTVARRAKSIRPILDAFQREGWPRRIDDPLPYKDWYATRIQEACDSLRKDLSSIDFRPDGSGKGVTWHLVADPRK